MAEMVGSAVVEATLKQAVAGLIGTQEEAAEVPGDGEQHVERLEMAQLRMEAVIEASRKWRIHDASLLRWRRKLKRAASRCASASSAPSGRSGSRPPPSPGAWRAPPRSPLRSSAAAAVTVEIDCRLFCRSTVGDEHR
jgi:hypothetical protein